MIEIAIMREIHVHHLLHLYTLRDDVLHDVREELRRVAALGHHRQHPFHTLNLVVVFRGVEVLLYPRRIHLFFQEVGVAAGVGHLLGGLRRLLHVDVHISRSRGGARVDPRLGVL